MLPCWRKSNRGSKLTVKQNARADHARALLLFWMLISEFFYILIRKQEFQELGMFFRRAADHP